MTRIEVLSKVGPDGVLHLEVPMGASEANREVRVTVEGVGTVVPAMSQPEWEDFVRRTTGSVTDPGFELPEQGQFEERDPL
jgi:hypothetical protein